MKKFKLNNDGLLFILLINSFTFKINVMHFLHDKKLPSHHVFYLYFWTQENNKGFKKQIN
jgi:hypothetical protein